MAFIMKNGSVAVSLDFINEYMPAAHGEYVKVYLYGLAAASTGRNASNEEIAALLHILVTDVENAWQYWEKTGLVEITGGDIVFVSRDNGEKPDKPKKEAPAGGRASAPHISASEVAKALEMNPYMKDTISMVEQFLEKPLSTREITSIFNFMDWYGMDSDMVLMLFEYCVSMGKKNFSYIEKVAQTWNEEGINDIKSAEAVIKRASEENRFQMQCRGIFGLDRGFSASEKKYLRSWREDMDFSLEMIEQAYEITVKNTGSLAFAYMNKVLTNWHQKGVKKPSDIKEKDAKPSADARKMDEQAVIEMKRRLKKS